MAYQRTSRNEAGRLYDTLELRFAAAAAAKLLQSCLTLCDPIDGSPLRSSVPGILQAMAIKGAETVQLELGLEPTCQDLNPAKTQIET